MPMFDMPGGNSMSAINLGELLGKALGQRTKTRRVTVQSSFDVLIAEESDKLIDSEQITAEAITAVQNDGIVFLDEIDKICSRGDGRCWLRHGPRQRARKKRRPVALYSVSRHSVSQPRVTVSARPAAADATNAGGR